MLLIKADVHRDGLIFPAFLYGKENPLIRRSHNFEPRRAALRRAILGAVEGIRNKNLLRVRGEIKREILHFLKGEYTGEIETDGLGMMARDMGYECWGMPNLEVRHRDS